MESVPAFLHWLHAVTALKAANMNLHSFYRRALGMNVLTASGVLTVLFLTLPSSSFQVWLFTGVAAAAVYAAWTWKQSEHWTDSLSDDVSRDRLVAPIFAVPVLLAAFVALVAVWGGASMANKIGWVATYSLAQVAYYAVALVRGRARG